MYTGQFRRGWTATAESAYDRLMTDEKTGRRFAFCSVASARATGGGGGGGSGDGMCARRTKNRLT